MHNGISERRRAPHAAAYALGWFSLALGAAELAAPGAIARGLGMRGGERLVGAYGGREVLTGLGILMSPRPTPMVWGRVAGDLLDLATLLPATRPENPRQPAALAALSFVLGATALDVLVAAHGSR